MRAISAGELTKMRATQQGIQIESCTVRTQTLAADGYGGSTSSDSTVSTTCRIDPVGSNTNLEDVTADQLAGHQPYIISLPYNTAVTDKAQIVVGTRVFDVIGVRKSSYNTDIECVCIERGVP